MSELREVTPRRTRGIVTGPGRGIGHEYALMRPNVGVRYRTFVPAA